MKKLALFLASFMLIFSFFSKISYEWYLVHIIIFEVLYQCIYPQTYSIIVNSVFAIIAFVISIIIAFMFHESYKFLISKIENKAKKYKI